MNDTKPNPDGDACRMYEVDGEPVAVHGARPLDDIDQQHLATLVQATKDYIRSTDPHQAVRQELVMACLAAMRCIPDGRVQFEGRCTVSDGAKVKTRLKAAVQAARDALTPERPS